MTAQSVTYTIGEARPGSGSLSLWLLVKLRSSIKSPWSREVSRCDEGVPAAASVGIRLGRDNPRPSSSDPCVHVEQKSARSLLSFLGEAKVD